MEQSQYYKSSIKEDIGGFQIILCEVRWAGGQNTKEEAQMVL